MAAFPPDAAFAQALAQTKVLAVQVHGAGSVAADPVKQIAGLVTGAEVDTTRLAEARDRVVRAFAAEGYFGARVSIAWHPPADSTAGGRLFTIDIDAGPAWHVTAIDQDGAPPEIAKRLPGVTKLRPGDRYRLKDLEAEIEAILDLYDELGHPYARVRPGSLDLAGGGVRLTLHHEPGPPVILSGLELSGARTIKPKTAERVMGFRPGRPYCQSQLEEGIERLRGSGLFSDVADAELVPGADPAASRVRLSVKEASAGSISGIIGYSGADRRLAGDLDFRLRNIAGSGRQLRARWSSRQRASTLYVFSYREPYLLGLPIDLSFDLQHVLFDTLYTRTQLDVGVQWRVGSRFTLVGGVGEDHAVITSVVRRSEGSLKARAGAQYDSRNSRQAPTAGIFASVEAERGRTLAGVYGDLAGAALLPVTDASFRGEIYHPVTRNTSAALLLTARSLDTRAWPVPQYELFPLGGANTLRGYREEQFYTPGFLLAQLEYRLGMNRFGTGAYLFMDAASFSDSQDHAALLFNGGLTKLGYGAGVRVGSRMGRLGVDYGLAAGDGPLDGRIHLRLEAEF